MMYVERRQRDEHAANATINRELSVLRRMFRLGERAGRTAHRPFIAMLEEDNARNGFSGRIPHDFRRTAVRNLERAGGSAAMAMVGHQTEAISRRYAITDEAMLKDAGEQLAASAT